MSDRIDHAAKAEGIIRRATLAFEEGIITEANFATKAAVAQVHATLALVEQQRIANLIALPPIDSATALYAGERLRPDIAAALGIGGASDG